MKTRYISPLFALLLSLPAYADKVIGIADGATLTVLHDRQPLKIRLANIDAQEKISRSGNCQSSLCLICALAERQAMTGAPPTDMVAPLPALHAPELTLIAPKSSAAWRGCVTSTIQTADCFQCKQMPSPAAKGYGATRCRCHHGSFGVLS